MFKTEEEKLSYFVSSFQVNHVPFFAKKPPSRITRRLSRGDIQKLMLVNGTSDLQDFTEKNAPPYRDAHIRRTDLWKHLRHLKTLNKQSDL